MFANGIKILTILLAFQTYTLLSVGQSLADNDSILAYSVDIKKKTIKFYWKDDHNEPYRNFSNLKNWLNKKGENLVFAMNGGMYKADNSPVGLFVCAGKTMTPLNTASASGNFYLKPNGVFYITSARSAVICVTEKFKPDPSIEYATQSGPMLVIDGKIHPDFRKGSSNTNIRNGVGILPNGHLLFAMSKEPINLYDFADYFKESGCKYALYLDGFVSRTFLPEKKWVQTDGNFGVIIAETTQLR